MEKDPVEYIVEKMLEISKLENQLEKLDDVIKKYHDDASHAFIDIKADIAYIRMLFDQISSISLRGGTLDHDLSKRTEVRSKSGWVDGES